MMGSVKRDKTVIFAGLLWIVQSVGRLCFAAFGTPEGMGEISGQPDFT